MLLIVSLIIAITAFFTAIGALIAASRRGIPTQRPSVEMPVVILSGNLNSTTKCADKTFRGTAELELLYLPAARRQNAEVRVTLNILRQNKVSVSLARTDLGVFRNDTTQSVIFDGELTSPCEDGDFTMLATVVNQGPGATTITEGERIFVPALDFTVNLPTHLSTSDGINFSFDLVITCCNPDGRHVIVFTNRNGVRNLRARPRRFTCNRVGDVDTITISGVKEDQNQVGFFTVNARFLGGSCVLGSLQVE